MSQALELAREAADAGEVPVGCVIVRDGAVIGRGRNRREEKQAVCSHAEMEAMAQANAALGSWRLDNCALYVTLEPCPMCAGAIINSRIRRVVYGAADTKAGCCGSVTDLFAMPFNHHPVVEQGLRAEEAQELLQAFFKDLRARLAARPKWKPPV
jgi:tRNA(adenine34) deaminase